MSSVTPIVFRPDVSWEQPKEPDQSYENNIRPRNEQPLVYPYSSRALRKQVLQERTESFRLWDSSITMRSLNMSYRPGYQGAESLPDKLIHRLYPSTSGFTIFGGRSPLKKATRFPAAMVAIFVRVSVVALAMCGGMITLSNSANPGARAGSAS